jgi:oxygen-independent coproporphyrinogen-3 oxidase
MTTESSISENQDASFISPDTLRKFDISGPRYTSYPTADRFSDAFPPENLAEALRQRQAQHANTPLSLYIHIPFCESLCFYCACNKIITHRHERGSEYLEYLTKEIALYAGALGQPQKVAQLHLGGGSPTFLTDQELSDLMSLLRREFQLPLDGEYSIEVDPRTVDSARLLHLAFLGFNRLSFGVQDFAPDVQQAIHRIQSTEQVFGLMETARALGFKSINVDLIYGLPKQTAISFEATIRRTIDLRPNRIALYAYAHLPERFKPQRLIRSEDLPDAHAKVSMLSNAISLFLDAGYEYIGMDHFALPNDALAIAKRQGTLHRNFQGYTTLPDCDLIALGVSAIGRIGRTYIQNAKTLKNYYRELDEGRFPLACGLRMTEDDLIRYAAIMGIMCQGRLQFGEMETRFGIDFEGYFSDELNTLQSPEYDGLLQFGSGGFEVTALGWYFVRGIAMIFDRHLRQGRSQTKFSRIL